MNPDQKIICNNCGNKLLPSPELINVTVCHINGKNVRKEEPLKVCCECYGHILKYPLDEMGCYKVDSDFKSYYIKLKKIYTKKKDKPKGELLVPIITIKGKEELPKYKPTHFSFYNQIF
jgi:hypothetical protein